MSTPIEQALFVYLYNEASVAALVSGRIYPLEAPAAKSYPYVVYQRVGGERLGSMGGAIGLAAPIIQFQCWGKTYSSAKAVANAIRQALNGLGKNSSFGGTYSATSYTVSLDSIWIGEESDDYDFETKAYGVMLPFQVWHQED